MKHKVSDSDVIATIVEKQLKDLVVIDGGDPTKDGKINFWKLKSFLKKHVRKNENIKLNANLESNNLPHRVEG